LPISWADADESGRFTILPELMSATVPGKESPSAGAGATATKFTTE
jgi:hypothetical protein